MILKSLRLGKHRNKPCPCGSGDKSKKCCMKIGGTRKENKLEVEAVKVAPVVKPKKVTKPRKKSKSKSI
jgi:hypothetical protein